MNSKSSDLSCCPPGNGVSVDALAFTHWITIILLSLLAEIVLAEIQYHGIESAYLGELYDIAAS